jgi:hypothetical protein
MDRFCVNATYRLLSNHWYHDVIEKPYIATDTSHSQLFSLARSKYPGFFLDGEAGYFAFAG